VSSLKKLRARFLTDQRGAEVSEVGLYLAIIVAGCVALMAVIGPVVVGLWQAFATAVGV
jgi:Flp pilus assembly pilin Flp